MKAVFVKRASDAEGVARLRKEASVLAWLSHPGTVRLVKQEFTDDRGELHLILVEGLTFNNAQFSLSKLTACMTMMAETLAHMHSLHVAHTALTPDHVMVGIVDRIPVFCGLGNARTVAPGAPELSDDVLALGRLLESKLPSVLKDSGERLSVDATRLAEQRAATLTRLVELSTSEDSRYRPSAQRFAQTLRSIGAPDVEPPTRQTIAAENASIAAKTKPTAAPGARHARMSAGIAAAAVVLLGALVTTTALGGGEEEPEPQVAGAVICQEVTEATVVVDVDDDGCGDAVTFGPGSVKVNDQQFDVGVEGDQFLVGNWNCEGGRTLAILRPSTDAVYVFDAWPSPGNEVGPRLVSAVAGAETAESQPAEPGCDALVVTTDTGETVKVDTRPKAN